QDEAEFLETIEDETDRLTALVSNLLDMSRLQAGVLQPSLRPVHLEEVVPAAIASLGERAHGVVVDVPETLSPVSADAALLERVVANLVENAMRWSPDDLPARVTAGRVQDRVDLRVIDHGPGISAASREQVFQPFQRLGDRGLPAMSGIEVIYGLRGWTEVPIIVLSARDAEREKIAALDAGADDYVTKPFGMGELLARVRAALRRGAPSTEEATVITEAFTIDLTAKRVTNGNGEVRLTPTEWHLVEVLVRNAGRLVTQRALLRE